MKRIAILLVLALAIMVVISAEGDSISTAAENNEGIQSIAERAHNIQETVYEDFYESGTDKARDFIFRHDISIEEIQDLRDASEAQVFERLGEPHGSVSGGSFILFQYVLENGDIVIFPFSGLSDTLPISIYDKNGEFKQNIFG